MSERAICSPIAEAYLRLHLCEDVGPIRFSNLIRELGGIDAVLSADRTTLLGVEKVGEKVASQVIRDRASDTYRTEIALAGEHGARIICSADPDYPIALRRIDDAPACIYVKGSLHREDAVALAVVGSRHCSRYGAEQAERFAGLAAGAGLTVVSGMARGVDSYAHEGALAASGRTVAVIGCGLCHIYPPESRELADKIVSNGAIVSELPMRTSPDPKNFPQRNRIIAGLSLGVLVVEAARRSGALITARLATEYNREVFAVPGRVDDARAEGCHDLIKVGGAKLVTNLADVLDELGDVGKTLKSRDESAPEGAAELPGPGSLDEAELRVLAVLGQEAVDAEVVCEQATLPPSRVAAVLTGLQLKGAVRRVGANLYEKVLRG